MVRFLLAAGIATVAMLTTGSARLHACSCAPSRAVCAAEWSADAVFVGAVTAILQLTEPEVSGSRRVTFAVQESFKGVDGRLLDVLTGSGGGDCGFGFTVGSTYLVYAHRRPTTGRLTTGICTRTALVARAGRDLELLRAPARPLDQSALIHGRAVRTELQTARTPRINEPFAGARVRLKGELGSWDTVTSADGQYEFRVPAGRYRLTAEVGDQLYSDPDATVGLDVRVIAVKPCAPIDIQVRSNGRIRGQLIDAAGRGIPFLSVDLVDRSRRNMTTVVPSARTMTDANGRFEFERLEPREYDIGLTLRRYPRRDANYAIFLQPSVPLDVGLGANLDAGTIRLPDAIDIRQVTGVVVDDAGAPVPHVEVRVVTPGKNLGVSSEPVVTDMRGRFLISVIAGRMHELVAEERSVGGDQLAYRAARSRPFDAASGQTPVTLRLKAP